MAHSSQGFYVVEDNETQLWNHMILWFKIIDGAVARPLAEVAWVWYKSDGSLLGILQESLFFSGKWNKANFLKLSICKTGKKFLQKKVHFINSVLLFSSVLWQKETNILYAVLAIALRMFLFWTGKKSQTFFHGYTCHSVFFFR